MLANMISCNTNLQVVITTLMQLALLNLCLYGLYFHSEIEMSLQGVDVMPMIEWMPLSDV